MHGGKHCGLVATTIIITYEEDRRVTIEYFRLYGAVSLGLLGLNHPPSTLFSCVCSPHFNASHGGCESEL